MRWWGKIIGGAFGYMVGGPIGLLIGAFVGHQFDKGMVRIGRSGPAGSARSGRGPGWVPGSRQRVQGTFFSATFSVMGHIAKADGRVTRDEINAAEELIASLHLSPDMRKQAIDFFRQGKESGFDLDGALDQLRMLGFGRRILLQVFVEIQLRAALADGKLHPKEREVLLHICQRLGIPTPDFEAMAGAAQAESHYGGPGGSGGMSLEDAYATLGVPSSAGDDEVKRAYRKLMSRHHPDKLIAKGLPPEMVRVATEKSQEIGTAYDRIRDSRQ
ncbi:MAG: co-chaperone DjlA [Pseudomonadota bacterium]|nr:co-chaperone DjlA [Pseudomonadota bacterium]